MADSNLTAAELFAESAITEEEVGALMAAYIASSSAGPLPLGDNYRLDVDAAIAAHPFSAAALSGGQTLTRRRRAAIRSAILLARPEKVRPNGG